MVEVKTHPLQATGKDDLKTAVETSKVLVVGAGGIGCELLKNLVLCGFRDILIIDLDTIDVSNLNRQFLFHKQHVSQSKAKVARESALSFEPEAKIEALHDSITSPKYGVSFFKQFALVMNALDNAAARSHVNRLCLAAEVPLIESGTAGYLGNVSVIKKGVSECYECMTRPKQKSYPGCTIRNTPSEPIHCIVWSKHLFNQLFGEEDADQDVSPDTDDPELGGNAGERALGNDKDNGEASKNGGASENGETSKKNGEDEKMDVSEPKPLQRVSTKAWAKEVGYDAKKLFMKFFNSDIKYLLSMDKLWEKRRPPIPLDCDDLPEEPGTSSSTSACIKDLRMWSLNECFAHFQQAVNDLKQRVAKPEGDSEVPILTWDKDDDASMDFVAACANVRAFIFGIPRKTRFDVKSMAGNIIPAIATTNAVIAGAIVVEAFKVLRGKWEESRSIALFKNPNPLKRLIVPSQLAEPNPNCAVCAPMPQVFLKCNPETFTVKSLEEKVLKGFLNMVAPDVNVDDGTGTILISSEEGETEENNDKPLKTFKIQEGTRLLCDDFLQNYNLAVVVMATDEAFEDGGEFVVLGKDALDAEMAANRKKEEDAAAEKTAGDAKKTAAENGDGPQSIDVEDDDLAFAGVKIYGLDDEDAQPETVVDGEVEERKRKREDEDDIVELEQPVVKKLKPVADEEPELVTLN